MNAYQHRKSDRQKWSRNAVLAKERKRMAGPAPDYPAPVDFNVPVETWTFTHHRSGKFNQIVLLPSPLRRNAYAVEVNGVVKCKSMGRDRAMRWIVKGLSR
jgi:hypothetical protein